MASNMIHYVISKRVAELTKIENLDRFLLGAVVAPDASTHADGSYDCAHFGGQSAGGTRKGIDFNRFADKYGERFETDSFYLGYWCHLIEDAVWLHDMADKYVRIHTGEEKKAYYQKGYRDYERLNYLLQKEYRLQKPEFKSLEVPVDEVCTDLIETMVVSAFGYFDAKPCEKRDLELYPWEVIASYIDNCVRICAEEIEKRKKGKEAVGAEQYYVAVRQ